MKQFAWLAEQAFGLLLYIWPVSITLVVLVCTALIADIAKRRLHVKDIACLCPMLGTAAILGMGALFKQNEQLHLLPYIGLAFCLLLAIFSVVKLKRIWRTALTVALFILWYSLW